MKPPSLRLASAGGWLWSTGAVFTWISSPGEKVSASNMRSFTLASLPGVNSIHAMTNPAAHSTIAGHCRCGLACVGTLTRNGLPLAPPPIASGRLLMAVAVVSDHAAMNCMLRKLVIAGAPADALINISAIVFLPGEGSVTRGSAFVQPDVRSLDRRAWAR